MYDIKSTSDGYLHLYYLIFNISVRLIYRIFSTTRIVQRGKKQPKIYSVSMAGKLLLIIYRCKTIKGFYPNATNCCYLPISLFVFTGKFLLYNSADKGP